MKEIKMPQFDVNDNMVTITELFVQDGVYVNKGDRILKAESTKMVRDVVAEVSGYLRWNVKCFETKTNGAVIAYLFDSKEDCDNFTVAQSTNCGEEVPANATAKAIALAKQLNIDINEVAKEKGEGIIKTSDVEKFSLKKGKNTSIRNTNYSVPTMINTFDRERVIIIGAGRMSEQIMDILLDDKDKCVVGVVDSYKTEYASYPLPLYTCDVYEFPDKIDRSFYDTVIISFGGDKKAMQFRKELYENYKQKDMKFTNAIGDNVNIRRAVSIGENNVIMHNCFIGTGAQIGNNNILSYGSYIGHHCVIGSHNLFAPGFVTPGSVRVGDDNIIMTGVQTINYVSIGNNTVLPVGYNVVNDIPDGTNLLNTNGENSMQAIMLAAGMGRRMGKYTKEYTKCMVNVGGRSLLERAIEALEYSGINKLVMVIGYEAEALRKFIESKNFNIQIEYVYNYDYATTNNIYSLYLAKEYLKKEDTILLESDLVYDKEIIKNLVKANEPNLAVVAKYEQWMDGTVVTIDKNCNITDFIDKTHFRYEDADHYYKTVNIYKFSKEFSENQYLPFLEAYLTAYGVNQYYEQVLKILAHIKDSELYAFVLQDEKWYEIDDVQDLDIANTIFAQDKDMIRKYEYHFGGFWRYPKLKDFCYLVNPYYPPKKMLSQIKFFFSDLLTQYPSGMRNQRLNASNMFDVDEKYLLVGNGAAELINVIGKYVSGKMVACVPTFNEYVRCFTNCDIQEIQTAKNGYRFDIDEIIKSLIDASTLLLINPDNPSGAYINYLDLIKILDMCKGHNILTIIDESFIDFADQEVRYTLVSEEVLEKYPNLVVIKSISKSYGIPGLRLGIMATSNAEILKYMISNLAIWNINSFAEYYLQIQRLYKKSYIESCNKIAEQRSLVYGSLSKNNKLIVYPSQANYIMCQIRDEAGITSAQLSLEMMKRYNILIKNLSFKKGFEGKNFIRVAIKNQEDNLLLIKAINEILN